MKAMGTIGNMGNMTATESIVEKQKTFFCTGATLPVEFRLAMLKKLREGITKHTEEISAALREDLGKSKAESYMTEIGMAHSEWRMRKSKWLCAKPKNGADP